jgi:hypothetical protein
MQRERERERERERKQRHAPGWYILAGEERKELRYSVACLAPSERALLAMYLCM